MANNKTTIDELLKYDTTAPEQRAVLDAIDCLQASGDMPLPVVRFADFGETSGLVLDWSDKSIGVWVRASFRGNGMFDWVTFGQNPDADDPTTIDDDSDGVPVAEGAPAAMVAYIAAMTKRAA